MRKCDRERRLGPFGHHRCADFRPRLQLTSSAPPPPGTLRPLVHRPERGAVLPDRQLAPAASRPSTASRSTPTSPCRRPGNGPFPTIVMLHGWGGSKTDFESTLAGRPLQQQLLRPPGYAVLNYTARGFGNSCGGGPSGDHSGPCGQGYIRLADTRYEARDTQYLLGQAGRRGDHEAEGDRRHRDLLRRRPEHGARLPAQQDPQAQRQARALAKPQRQADGDRAPPTRAGPGRTWSTRCFPTAASSTPRSRPSEQSLNPVGVPIQSYLSGPLSRSASRPATTAAARPASTPVHERRREHHPGLRRDPGGPAAVAPTPRPR